MAMPPPPPPPQDSLPHVEPPEAASEPPKKRPWSKPTVRNSDGVIYTVSGPTPKSAGGETPFYHVHVVS